MIMMMAMMMMINTQPVIKWCLTDISAQQGSSEFSCTREQAIYNPSVHPSFRPAYPVWGRYPSTRWETGRETP